VRSEAANRDEGRESYRDGEAQSHVPFLIARQVGEDGPGNWDGKHERNHDAGRGLRQRASGITLIEADDRVERDHGERK